MPCVIQDWRSRRGADAGVHERRVARRDARAPASCTCGAARAPSCGARARRRATPRRCRRSATTATATLCSRWSSRPARRATRASAPASTAASSSRRAPHEALPALERTIAARGASRAGRLVHGALLADPPRRRREGPRGGRGGRARRARGERRARGRGGRRRALPPRRPAARPRADAWPTPKPCSVTAGAAEPRWLQAAATEPDARGGPRARARAQPRAGLQHVPGGLRDAGLRLPQAARRRPRVPARVRRAGPARRALVVHRLPAAPGRALVPGRRRRSLRARGRRGLAPAPGAAARTCRRSRAARSASSATTACAPSSRSGRAEPRPIGLPDMALMLTDVLVAFDHLATRSRCSPTPTSTRTASRPATQRARRGDRRGPRAARRPAAAARAAPPARGARASSRTCRARRSRRWSRGSSSTCTPATPSRSCRRSAGRRPSASTPFSIYRGLRAINPSPYMYFLDFEDFQVVGASPEPLVTVTGGARHDAADRRHAAARRRRRRGPRDRRRTCSPTRRSAPST